MTSRQEYRLAPNPCSSTRVVSPLPSCFVMELDTVYLGETAVGVGKFFDRMDILERRDRDDEREYQQQVNDQAGSIIQSIFKIFSYILLLKRVIIWHIPIMVLIWLKVQDGLC